MEWVETTGRTVAEALDAALDELGVDEDDVEYEVVEQPRTGLLARFSGGGARIRARVKPISREKPGERQRRNRRGGSGQGRSSSERPSRSRSGNSSSGDARASGDEKSSGAGSAPQGAGRNRPEGAQPRVRHSRRRGRRGGQGTRGAGSTRAAGETAPDAAQITSECSHGERSHAEGATKGNTVETIEPEVTIEEQAEAAEAFTQGLVDAFDLGAQVRSVIVDEGIVVDVTGESLGLLVGPRGATLNAIEELVRTVVQRQTDGHGVRINVDVAGYRAKRREALEEFTRGIAEKVLETGRAQALEPMSALDRKVVHDAASEIDGVATESAGRGAAPPGRARSRRRREPDEPPDRIARWTRTPLLVEILEDARARGFLGPEPVEHHIEHSRDLADAVGAVPRDLPRPRLGRRRARARARDELARGRRDTPGVAAAALRVSRGARSSASSLGDRVAVREGRAEDLARDPRPEGPGRPRRRPGVRSPCGDRRVRRGLPASRRPVGGDRATGGHGSICSSAGRSEASASSDSARRRRSAPGAPARSFSSLWASPPTAGRGAWAARQSHHSGSAAGYCSTWNIPTPNLASRVARCFT